MINKVKKINLGDGDVRVRFAPSPTGHLHIGSLRVALFNWLFLRHNNGKFLVRIEDTDLKRSSSNYVKSIIEALEWVDLESDEPIIFQSERFDLYKNYIDRLLKIGAAYWSDPEKEENKKSTLRFKVPREKEKIIFNDLIRGEISFETELIDDFVIARYDGSPLYNLVVVVDDIEMKISHVIRGEDHISNTPRQILIYEALRAQIPKFAHLPMILAPTGSCLSKRDAAVSVLEYRDCGYLPGALCNYLVRLGWAHGNREIFTRDELISLFSLKDVNKSGAIFDCQKLAWVNSVYLKNSAPEILLEKIVKYVEPGFQKYCSSWSKEQLIKFINLYKERVHILRELVDELIRLNGLSKPKELPDGVKWNLETGKLLELLEKKLWESDNFFESNLKNLVKEFCKEYDIELFTIAKPIRFALTGGMESPAVFKLMELFGKVETLKRIEKLRFFLIKL